MTSLLEIRSIISFVGAVETFNVFLLFVLFDKFSEKERLLVYLLKIIDKIRIIFKSP